MTLEEIAKEIGVSKSTVSRALSGKGRIGEKTRNRILEVAKRAVELQNFYADLQKAVWLYTSENALEPDTARINSFETYCSYTH